MNAGSITLDATPRSASAARTFVTEVLANTPASACSDVVGLLTSELVTNAVLHAHSSVEVNVTVDGSIVRVDVYDALAQLPELIMGAETFSGRGLQIVQSLARRWGADALPGGGKTVWFEVAAE